VARVQRQQRAVVDRRGLDFEIEGLAQALANRQSERPIRAHSQRRVNYDLGAAQSVEETLGHDRMLVGNRAQRGEPPPDVRDRLGCRRFAQRTLGFQPPRSGFRVSEPLGDLASKLAHLSRHRGGASRAFV